jgi:hypothetical protein
MFAAHQQFRDMAWKSGLAVSLSQYVVNGFDLTHSGVEVFGLCLRSRTTK